MKITIQQAIITHQEGKLEEAEQLYRSLLETDPTNLDANNNLGVLLFNLGRFDEAEKYYRKAIEFKADYAEAHNNLGSALKNLKRLDEAEISFNKAIEHKTNYAEAYYNLGNLLSDLKRLDEAEASFNKAIKLKPDHAETHNNLGNILRDLKRFDDAEKSYRKAIELKPDYAEAHSNLGTTLYSIGNLIASAKQPDETEKSYRKAIELKPDHAETHNNLGVMLLTFDRLDEAEISFAKAIELKPDYTEARYNLQLTFKLNKLLLNIQQIKNPFKKTKFNFINKVYKKLFNYHSDVNRNDLITKLNSNPFISNRKVEDELIPCLYKINYKKPDEKDTKNFEYQNQRSSDFNLFEDDSPIIKNFSKDLIAIMEKAVKSDIFISESFFNIWQTDSGIAEHTHITDFDKNNGLIDQKFSLTYYLDVGDQNCSEPGYLKLYDPDKEILPKEGMIAIFPASRKHSAVYNGKTDRVMIGINFL